MCQRVVCNSCGKPGYSGCGRHVEAVLADVPLEARCHCRESDTKVAPETEKSATSWLLSCLGGSTGRRK